MKYFVFSDVHGFYAKLQKELDRLGFDENNPDHCLISLGDLFDRGPENIKMFEFIKKMVNKNKIILVKGNHEDLFELVLENKDFLGRDYHNKTYETFCEFAKYLFPLKGINAFYDNYEQFVQGLEEIGVLPLIRSMKNYHETKDYIFVHGFIPTINNTYLEGWREVENWWDARWSNGMKMGDEYLIGEPNKKIVCGHFHCNYGNVRKIMAEKGIIASSRDFEQIEFADTFFKKADLEKCGLTSIYDIYYGKNVICIDACTAYSKQLNIFTFEE